MDINLVKRFLECVELRAVNGHCLKCGHRLVWIVIRGKRGRLSFTSKPDFCHLNDNAFRTLKSFFQVKKYSKLSKKIQKPHYKGVLFTHE